MTRLTRHYVVAVAVIVVVLCTVQLLRFPRTPTISAEPGSKYDELQKGWRNLWQSYSGEGQTSDTKESKDSSSFGEEDTAQKLGNEGTWYSAPHTAAAPAATPSATEPDPNDDLEEDESDSGQSPPSSPSESSTRPTFLPLGDFDPREQSFDVPADIIYDPAGPRPEQVILLTASDGKGHNGGIEDILGQTAENRRTYCEHHGYINQFINISKYDLQGAHPVWAKLPAIIESFQTHPDAQWVWWLDLDAIIMTPTVTLNDLILSHSGMRKALEYDEQYVRGGNHGLGIYTPSEDKMKVEDIDLLMAQDHNGLNAGSFMIRRSIFTQGLMDVWRDPFFVERTWEGKEQDAILHLMEHHPTIRSHIGLIHQRVINAYPVGGGEMGWKTGDLVVHFAGCWVKNHCQEQWKDFWNRKKSV